MFTELSSLFLIHEIMYFEKKRKKKEKIIQSFSVLDLLGAPGGRSYLFKTGL